MYAIFYSINNAREGARLSKSCMAPTAENMLTPGQLRAARGLLGWSQKDLATACGGVRHLSTIQRFELGLSDPKQSTLLLWRRVLSEAGVELIDETEAHGPGVMLRKSKRK